MYRSQFDFNALKNAYEKPKTKKDNLVLTEYKTKKQSGKHTVRKSTNTKLASIAKNPYTRN